VVRADGKVLVDSEANAAEMENHRTRPELMQAFRGQAGSSIATAPPSACPFCMWRCRPRRWGGAIRIAVPLAEINQQVNRIRGKILASTALSFSSGRSPLRPCWRG